MRRDPVKPGEPFDEGLIPVKGERKKSKAHSQKQRIPSNLVI